MSKKTKHYQWWIMNTDVNPHYEMNYSKSPFVVPELGSNSDRLLNYFIFLLNTTVLIPI